MTWNDAIKILHSSDIGDETELMKELSQVENQDVIKVESVFREIDKMFANVTEMDASIRVVMVLVTVFQMIPEERRKKLKIKCQPSVGGHSVFTDFLIIISEQGDPRNSEKLKLLIEVKKGAVNTSLFQTSSETAQVIREVHIALKQNGVCEPFPFIITNAATWSFGLAERINTKVSIISRMDVYTRIKYTPTPFERLLQLLKKYLC